MRSRPRSSKHARWLLLSIAAVVAVSCPGADAATWHSKRALVSGPVLAGGGVAWLAARRDPGADPVYPPADLFLARPGKKPRRIQAFPAQFEPHHESLNYAFGLAASSSHIAVQRFRFCTGRLSHCGDQLDTFVGGLGSRLERIQRCERTFHLSTA